MCALGTKKEAALTFPSLRPTPSCRGHCYHHHHTQQQHKWLRGGGDKDQQRLPRYGPPLTNRFLCHFWWWWWWWWWWCSLFCLHCFHTNQHATAAAAAAAAAGHNNCSSRGGRGERPLLPQEDITFPFLLASSNYHREQGCPCQRVHGRAAESTRLARSNCSRGPDPECTPLKLKIFTSCFHPRITVPVGKLPLTRTQWQHESQQQQQQHGKAGQLRERADQRLSPSHWWRW